MKWRKLLVAIAGLVAWLGLQVSGSAAQPTNVVVILADDLGWTDLGCYGSDFYETPHIDRLARDGMRFTQSYSACTVCSPTRAALLTGKYPARLHITDWIPGQMPDNPKLLVPEWTKHLPTEETTLAERLKPAGYTAASIGKWHLGGEDYYPEKHGFDINIAGSDKAAPPSYHAPWKIPTLSEGKDGEYLTGRLSEEAVKFIERAKDKPFFLYLSHFAVHTPLQGRADLVQKYKHKLKAGLRHTNVTYAAMVESLDESIGRLCQKLDELKLADRTVIIFTSDNGGRITQGTTTNAPLRYGKASAYEGGVRVPLIVHWPGVTKPGSVCDAPVITMDLFPTVLEMCGLEPSRIARDGTTNDGVSLTALLRGSGSIQRDTLFWHYPHHQHYQLGGTMPYGAIRAGDFKLIEFFDDMRVELYNIREDIGEQRDLAGEMPKKVKELRARLVEWRREVGAQMPVPNPNYDASKPQYNPPAARGRRN